MLIEKLSGGEVVGYIVDECIDYINIKIDNQMNERIRMKRPIFNSEDGKFEFENPPNDLYHWVEYHPIRFKLMKSGKVNFSIYNRMHINVDEDVIVKI